jgi:hypothetical protein
MAPAAQHPEAGMPMLYIAFLIVAGLGLFVIGGVSPLAVADARALVSLAGLPRAAPPADAAWFRGVLRGPRRTTPLGHAAVAWLARVQASGKVSSVKCRLGELGELRLQIGTETLALPAPTPELARTSTNHVPPVVSTAPIYWLGPPEERRGIPANVLDRCGLAHEPNHDLWHYVEQHAAPDAVAAFAGCRSADTLAACGGGPAGGHLAVGGSAVLLRELADHVLGNCVFIATIGLFFAIVAGLGATFTLWQVARKHPRP